MTNLLRVIKAAELDKAKREAWEANALVTELTGTTGHYLPPCAECGTRAQVKHEGRSLCSACYHREILP